ncbi:MAG: flagellar export protein FliJ [Gammaproteobacteria bacterium]|nr:flagellar export protein FliJ [Gammaproteobacteria bacterium]
MTKSQRLRPVATMKHKEQMNSARILNESFGELKKQEEYLAELRHYRDDYLTQFRQVSKEGASIDRIRHYQEFIARLDQSIVVQMQRFEEVKHQVELKKVDWKQARARSDAFDKVVDRYRNEEHLLSEKRSQKEADDQAQRSGNHGIGSHH